jgi:hypothetical protein
MMTTQNKVNLIYNYLVKHKYKVDYSTDKNGAYFFAYRIKTRSKEARLYIHIGESSYKVEITGSKLNLVQMESLSNDADAVKKILSEDK